jgi:HEAT repeat protein
LVLVGVIDRPLLGFVLARRSVTIVATPTIHGSTLERIRSDLDAADAAARAQAVEALASIGDDRGLVAALASPDAYVRRVAVGGLASRPGERLTWRLTSACFDESEDVRSAVARALGRRKGRIAAHALQRLVERDESATVRFHAVVAIAEADAPKAEVILRVAAEVDPEPRVRDMAAALLRRRARR